MSITQTQIAHLAALASLSFSRAEIAALEADLSATLALLTVLDELDAKSLKPTTRISDAAPAWRPDEVAPPEVSPESLLALAPALVDDQIKVPRVL